jgi:hypothetical protein
MQALAEEQEVIGVLSNLVMEVYAVESALLRMQRTIARRARTSPRENVTSRELMLMRRSAARKPARDARSRASRRVMLCEHNPPSSAASCAARRPT